MSLRITQVYANALGASVSSLVVSQVYGNYMGRSTPRQRITQVYGNIMGSLPRSPSTVNRGTIITQIYANVMVPFTPEFEWFDMLIEEVFPKKISYNSVSTITFNTSVAIVDSGHDQRTARWSQALMEFDVAYGVRTLEDLHALMSFFRSMQGMRHAFLYDDIMDNTSTLAVKSEARTTPPISPLDQVIAVGDHRKYEFQLIKNYTTAEGHLTHKRIIRKPKTGTVMIALDGVTWTFVDVDHRTGKIKFRTDWEKTGLNGMSLQETSTSNVFRMAGAAGTFTGLRVGDKIITSGWVNPVNNNTDSTNLTILAIAPDGSWINYSGFLGYGETETNVSGVRIFRHPAPRTGVTITAGYHFHVPVRFKTDRMPTTLEDFGVGGAADVKLIEVRPSQEEIDG